MGSTKKKKSSREDSASFVTPLFSDLNASQAQNSQKNSDVSLAAPHLSWMKGNEKPDTSTSGLNTQNSNDTHADPSMETPGNIRSNIRDASYDIKDAGTGHHDNRMAKLPPGQFREPSLRRGYGMPYQEPKAFDSMPAKGTSQVRSHHPQVLDSLPEIQTQSSISDLQQSFAISQRSVPTWNKDGKNLYDLNWPQARRGDLQPAGYRPVAMRPPGTSGRVAADEKQGQSSDEKQTPKIVIDLGSYQTAEQKALLKACLENKDLYLHSDGMWKVVKGCVEKWCEPRRFQLAQDEHASSDSELNTLLDKWNSLYAKKFCSANRSPLEAAGWRKAAEQSQNGSPSDGTHNSQASHESNSHNEKVAENVDVEGSIWPTVKEELMEFAESRILRWAEDKLQERLQALESLTRPPLLKANSSPESYRVYLRYLMNRTEAAGKNSKAIRNTEAVMSMALDLLPGLEERLRDQLEGVVDKQEDRPGAGVKHDQTNDTDHDKANDESKSAHENSEDADHGTDHKVQEVQEENDHDDGVQARLECDSEDDEDGDADIDDFEDFEEFYADESDDDTYEDPDEPNRKYRGSIIDTIEPRTPIVTPRVMSQLRRYEQRYRDKIITAKVETETAAAVLRSVDEEDRQVAPRKRKASDSVEPALAIRSKSMDQRLAVVGTPTPAGRKRQKLSEVNYSPASTACSSELLPSLEDIFSSSIGRASSATTQPLPNSSSPAVRANKKKSARKDRSRAQSKVSPELGEPATDDTAAPKPEEMTGMSPGLFVTPDVARQANTPFHFKKSVSRRPSPEERFREETAEFQAMTPSARESMLYTALREMRRRQG
ncbi:uncharacterized protein FMAN_02108 [Fusarium mangiferae]|uniref:Uncharacterized protein n=1 Tax=Fusarium mangiferae TaxID=192010 RepID=A0A1L7TWN0_FUSMA|nr:uncharacterized protein FMAN_02108 [Fusarium mangiferae]CVK99216.1 uncharacterized protein FMAN_02108 [Fusarium mangiferae]